MSAEDSFPLPRAELIALFLESLLFGAFAVLYSISIWILLYREKHHGRSKVHKWMFATATTMFVLALAHLCFDVQRAIEGFIANGGTPSGTADFYNRLSNPTHVAKSAIYITQTLVGDAFVTYRLYVVFNRNPWILVLPLSLLVGTGIAGYGICVVLTQIKGSGAIFSRNLVPWITSFFSLSLTTNVITTTLISGRIMWSNYRVRRYRAGYAAVTHWGVVETIVQSAAIYSAALVSLLATYVSGSNAQYVCLDSLQPLIGIVFTLIIIRVGLNDTTSEHSKGHMADSRITTTAPVLPPNVAGYPLRPLAISVSVSRTHDRTSFEGFDRKEAAVTKDSDIESGHGSTP
ncbi:hypothetical protein BD309DRAFT_970594 [Dichomitus squalens]|uniref:Uncharacterized protein n=1 Tax=Dichomitus squalens TaxID=114155 RepID=A0A4Q9PG74_9APHY|nr:hypothetical protein BD309DRAFT_970594 [Dichomitus squalens]TBU51991.1 hypothetical protein BD310DRAFT_982162 [Dichomitus squalens]